jgi:hypothetical protein
MESDQTPPPDPESPTDGRLKMTPEAIVAGDRVKATVRGRGAMPAIYHRRAEDGEHLVYLLSEKCEGVVPEERGPLTKACDVYYEPDLATIAQRAQEAREMLRLRESRAGEVWVGHEGPGIRVCQVVIGDGRSKGAG